MEAAWHNMMVLGPSVIEKIVRPVIVYVFLIAGLRLAGKRELAQLNPFDLVVLLTLSNSVQNAIIGDDNSLIGGLIGASTLLGVNYLVVRFFFSHKRLERFAEGQAVVLIEHGQVRSDKLKREFIALEELEAAARKQGLESLQEVDKAILESGGTISFVRKEPTAEAARYQELLGRLDRLSEEVLGIRSTLSGRGSA